MSLPSDQWPSLDLYGLLTQPEDMPGHRMLDLLILQDRLSGNTEVLQIYIYKLDRTWAEVFLQSAWRTERHENLCDLAPTCADSSASLSQIAEHRGCSSPGQCPLARGSGRCLPRPKEWWAFPLWCSGKRIQLGTMRSWVPSLASLSGLRMRHCRELWCRSQTRLWSCVAMAAVPIRPLAWEPPYAAGVALKSKKRRKKEASSSSSKAGRVQVMLGNSRVQSHWRVAHFGYSRGTVGEVVWICGTLANPEDEVSGPGQVLGEEVQGEAKLFVFKNDLLLGVPMVVQ